ncbi:ATP-dependent Clp protease ATP-binding subunit ClpX [Myxococcota bacterium]|nr:ATP-dependent Clp protease ATP-binding subunit ClpX [Myxococcota bacterium]MBU1412247.1 ATP-dependent Clp protease ATP-binding subunit ClpX [Myxococcota bacterium]MBU1512241.1 ATP-dependent Clp protease ATP-binding subunit ClpX [Myxococcota bacterium]
MLLDEIKCSFCQKKRAEVRKIITGPKVHICYDCVNLCAELLEREEFVSSVASYKPQVIFEELNRFVVGQDIAKKYLAVAVYNHYKRLDSRKRGTAVTGSVELTKGNILLLGPTGTGKTLLVETLAKKLDIPLAMGDATTLTEAGYVGEDVDSLLKNLYRAAGNDVEKAARGIIVIDEIDKIARRGSGSTSGRDVSGEGVQQGLLKMLEGKIISIQPDSGKGSRNANPVLIDTTDILFILSGAFHGIEDIVQRRVGTRAVGFGVKDTRQIIERNQLRTQVQNADFYKYGMIPEFMGRVPIIVPFNDLTIDDLTYILHQPVNALTRQYQKLLAFDQVELVFTADALRAIATKAHKMKMGARGLRTVIEDIMLDVMYDLPSLENITRCIIDEAVVVDRKPPHLETEPRAASAGK